ncbi:hypothetical protein EC973_004422 [Apophysomyces ossiformis]|uniref:Epidermal growth factor receptor substrate 15-like 1 n=1 Tax=Apophysomyces ossiformis TaxID=679940 RepID=A0A8H7ERX5_9FUNG|nr:hypothetical protein EC973_004422 [Apophysomyces ossiformis]
MSSNLWQSYLSPNEVGLYQHLFKLATRSRPEVVTGTEAVQFFASSGIPNAILSEIWEVADRDNLGYLTLENFSVALKLIACAQHGKEVSDPILSTSSPLPQFEGISLGSPTTDNALPIPGILPAEREKYIQIFHAHQPINGSLDEETVKAIFIKSKLPTETLDQIWQLADVRRSKSLDLTEFCVAMHFIAKTMDRTLSSLPSTLPAHVYSSAAGTHSPLQSRSQSFAAMDSSRSPVSSAMTQTVNWDIPSQEKIQHGAFFDKIDTERTGFVEAKDAVEFFRNSRLPETDLAHVWDIADSTRRGRLSRDEFIVAMHLIHKRLRGEPLTPSVAKTPTPCRPTYPLDTTKDDQDLLSDFSSGHAMKAPNGMTQLQGSSEAFDQTAQGTAAHTLTPEETLKKLQKQKVELQACMVQLKMAHEAEAKDLAEIQEKLRQEEAEWNQIREEHQAIQQQLTATQNEVSQLNNVIKEGRGNKIHLENNIRVMQDENARLVGELEQIRLQVKQQDMMLDINQRQVTASEQDRDLARRNLKDYREEQGLPKQDYQKEDKETTSTKADAIINLKSFNIISGQSHDEMSKGQNNSVAKESHDFNAIFDDPAFPSSMINGLNQVDNIHSEHIAPSSLQNKHQPIGPKMQHTPEVEHCAITVLSKDNEDKVNIACSAKLADCNLGDNKAAHAIANFDELFPSDAKGKVGNDDLNEMKITANSKDTMAMTTIMKHEDRLKDEGLFDSGVSKPLTGQGMIEDEWDAIFGGGSTTTEHVGFEDTFLSFTKEAGEKERTTTAVTQEASGKAKEDYVGDKRQNRGIDENDKQAENMLFKDFECNDKI